MKPTNQPPYLLTHPLTHPLTHLPTHLPTYLPTYLLTPPLAMLIRIRLRGSSLALSYIYMYIHGEPGEVRWRVCLMGCEGRGEVGQEGERESGGWGGRG